MGRFGRNRSNVWTYAGVNSFGRERLKSLASHPTVTPIAMVADALLDCTAKGDVVLDPFLGSGITLLAAEKVGRIGYGIEFEPTYVDVAVKRWEATTKLEAVLMGSSGHRNTLRELNGRGSEAKSFPRAAVQLTRDGV